MNERKAGYTLRQVVELTGISEFTLRGWEGRYRAFRPRRSPSGRRFYDREDVQRARLLLQLTEGGHRISEIATADLGDLVRLLGKDSMPGSSGQGPPVRVSREREKLFRQVDRFDWKAVEKDLSRWREEVGDSRVFIRERLVPLMSEVGARVADRRLSIAQEHILSALLRQNLALTRAEAPPARGSARFVFATPEGDHHELGLLAAASLAAVAGARHLYLGPNMPKRDLAECCLRYDATHVVLAATVSRGEGAHEDLEQFLHFLDRHLPPATAVWLGGRRTQGLFVELGRELRLFGDLGSLDAAFRALPGAID